MPESKLKLKMQRFLPVFSVIRSFCVEFCDNSNIHGLRYLSERRLHWSERLLWLVAIGVSLWMCGSLTRNIWIDWSDNPVTINIIEKDINISSLPFPTVTVCPAIKSTKGVFDVAAALVSPNQLSNIDNRRLNALAHICPRLQDSMEFQEDFTDESIYETFQGMAFQYDDIFDSCIPVGQSDMMSNCENLIFPVFTSVGLCFTFNALNSHDIYTDQMAPGMMILNGNPNVTKFNFDKDLFQTPDEKMYPYHTKHIGSYGGFLTIHNLLKPIGEFHCDGLDEGMNLMVTMPGESLATARNVHRIPPFEDARVSFKPKLTITSQSLRSIDSKQRQCFFDSERQLRFFRIYNQANCEEECLANFTAINCECVSFFMPRDGNTTICGAAKIKCYKSAARKFRSDLNVELFRDQCNCLPACNSVEYIVKIERFEIKMQEFATNGEEIVYFVIQLQLFFESFKAEIVERVLLYSYADFFADCGSLLGLFMGISALSIIEMIYYFTLRLFLTVRPIQISFADDIFRTISKRFTDSRLFEWRLKWATMVFADFSDNSNIHGLLYFTRRGLHWIERLWWLISFGLSVWLCSDLIADVWIQWQENPVKLTYSDVPISSIPFPTVTICPDIKSTSQKLSYDILQHDTQLEMFIFHAFSPFPLVFHHEFKSAQFSELSDNESIYRTIQDIALKLDDVVQDCRWQGQLINCTEYFVPILAEDGLCFAFNALNSHEIYTEQMAQGLKFVRKNPNVSHWNIESGYEQQSTKTKYPKPLINSLELTLVRYERDNTFLYKIFRLVGHFGQGFKVAFTFPGEMWRLSRNYLQVQTSEIAQITLNPKLTTTSKGLRKFTPNQRRCFFQSERQLRFFRVYTKSNCEAECLANLTRSECGCVEFSLPRDGNTPICGLYQYHCYHSLELQQSWSNIASDTIKFESKLGDCNCLPACTSVEYNPGNDRVKLRDSSAKAMRSSTENTLDAKYAKLAIFFDNEQIEATHQVEMYTVTDFLAICGGLLGLFMGASTLSIIEIIYFFTLRAFWSIRRDRIETGDV